MPRVLNKHRDVITKDAVYIGRGSKWGNPFVIGRDGDRAEVVDKFIRLRLPDLVEDAKRELAGKDLVCFCTPDLCHGNPLLEVANS